ncbi:DNA adenine methylase [uncultured Methanobrevibacter sp.]|uniref:DNA adenine methylase n=1 Tax=uncultured Methanobrevibacter sp. TaxID=253161 RepID=UPI0025FF7EB0|nr:DNA adenine methylase [uncultured Methanobrevibacter sp.]
MGQTNLFNYKEPIKINTSYDSFKFPSTRYQGSKLKLCDWIEDETKYLDFTTVLDAFGGTGCVSYTYKKMGKQVTYNDLLNFNYQFGKALIENNETTLNEEDIHFILKKHDDIEYKTIIQDNFKDTYFTDEENKWLDMVIANMNALNNEYKFALAFFALSQACIIKRPYNLFHRKNLYMRTSDVKRSFGNKKTWDTPFQDWFLKFVDEANNSIFNNKQDNISLNLDAMEIPNVSEYDLVYIDTPYISSKGSTVDYYGFYHFLEGMLIYDEWEDNIDYKSKHNRLIPKKNVWNDKKAITNEFDKLINKYQDSILVISYRSDGIPSKEKLEEIISQYKSNVAVKTYGNYKYALSKNKKSEELLFIGE